MMTASQPFPPVDDRLWRERAAADRLLANLQLPAGWRALRCAGRLEGRWSKSGGRRLELSIRLSEATGEPREADDAGPLVRILSRVGDAQLALEIRCSVLDALTLRALNDLSEALEPVCSTEADSAAAH